MSTHAFNMNELIRSQIVQFYFNEKATTNLWINRKNRLEVRERVDKSKSHLKRKAVRSKC